MSGVYCSHPGGSLILRPTGLWQVSGHPMYSQIVTSLNLSADLHMAGQYSSKG
jgi:hypothetical protein